jgi:hypothetical protein
MDQTGGATTPSNAALGNDAAVPLFNDVRFVLFPLLPAELRRAIWLFLLQQYRSIDMYLRDGYISEEDKLQPHSQKPPRQNRQRSGLFAGHTPPGLRCHP